MQMQCTTALACDAQTEGKVSVKPMSRLPRNNRKTYSKSFAASAELACGQPSQEAPMNVRDQPIDGSFLCTFWNIDCKVFLLGSLSIQCKIKCDRFCIELTSSLIINLFAINLFVTPGLFQCLNWIFLVREF